VELTSEEVQALDAILEEAIAQSSEDDGDPVFQEVKVNDVNPFTDEKTLDEVYTDLSKQGFIQCSGPEDENGNEVLEFVCITPEGLEALKAAKRVH
jgi:hypothetical protein